MKKLLVVVLLLAVGGGAFWYYRTRAGRFDMAEYRETIAKAQQVMVQMRQALGAPAGDLTASLAGTPAAAILGVDRKFFQDLGAILTRGATSCAGSTQEVQALQVQYMQTRAQLASGLDRAQMTPLMGLAFLQVSLEGMQALEPALGSFVASCPRDSKALRFLLGDTSAAPGR
jgi:hypothetical protein